MEITFRPVTHLEVGAVLNTTKLFRWRLEIYVIRNVGTCNDHLIQLSTTHTLSHTHTHTHMFAHYSASTDVCRTSVAIYAATVRSPTPSVAAWTIHGRSHEIRSLQHRRQLIIISSRPCSLIAQHWINDAGRITYAITEKDGIRQLQRSDKTTQSVSIKKIIDYSHCSVLSAADVSQHRATAQCTKDGADHNYPLWHRRREGRHTLVSRKTEWSSTATNSPRKRMWLINTLVAAVACVRTSQIRSQSSPCSLLTAQWAFHKLNGELYSEMFVFCTREKLHIVRAAFTKVLAIHAHIVITILLIDRNVQDSHW